ncbi:O-acyltransferase like protein-like [Dermacentor albipictus]|uniref:O-acyltransferase like protein-like n=1 Tax=Dermacentor albipictus TaxID=60249 RepID=UPI0038FC0992
MACLHGSRLLLLLLTTIITPQCHQVRAQGGPDSAGIEVNMLNLTSTSASSSTSTMTTTTAKPDRAKEAYLAISDKMTRFATREFYPFVSELIYDPRLSPRCIGSLMKIGGGLRRTDIWAVQTYSRRFLILFEPEPVVVHIAVIDAMGRPPAGMMQGRLSGYGAYDLCLAVRHDEGLFQGKYCMVHLRYDGEEMSPSVKKVVTRFANYLGFEVSTVHSVEATPVRCIFAVWVSFILFGTGYDIYRSMLWGDEFTDSDKTTTVAGYVSKAVRSFSLRRALKKLAQMPNWGDYSNELGFIHGFRVFSATWVILGHTYLIRDPHAHSNFIGFFKRLREDFLFSVQVNSFMSVETFLVITGFLSGYLVTKAPRVHLSPVIVVIIALFRRYVRLIVPMLALLGFMYLIPALIDGPALRDYWSVFEKPCTKNWWKIITMTENYFDNIRDLCLPHYWYIAVDFQLAIFTTVILAVITPRWPKASLWLMAIIAAATSLATAIKTYVKDSLPFNIIFTTDVRKLMDMQTEFYFQAYTHAPPLFIGIVFGCLATQRHQLSRLVQAAAWVLAATVSLAALLGVRTWAQGREPERLESAIYAGFHRASWALGTGWVMYACATKRGGLVNRILSWPCFYPLGRLSFSVYLVHLVLMACNSAQMYVSQVIMAYALASIVYLLVECPVASLDNLVFSKLMPKETILKVMQGKATAQEVKYIEALAQAKSKKAFDLASKQTDTNEFSGSTKHNRDNRQLCYANGACETDMGEDTQANGAVISVKF